MKVLITGGAGFIGSHLADKLLSEGHSVLSIDNYQTGNPENLTLHENLTVVEGTIADKALVDQVFADFRPDIVVHAAASYKDPTNWEEDAYTNILGTIHIAQASKKLEIERLIYFQTALCYGLQPKEQPITLNHQIDSRGSSYSISKTAGEQYIQLSGLDFISFRLANAYGPRNISGPLPTFFQRLSNGKPCFVMNTRRDFIYIDDLIKVVHKAVHGQGSRGYYHISSGSDFSIKELFEETLKAMKISLDHEVEERARNPDDVETILIDSSATQRDFLWKVSTPLSLGVANTVAWYQKHGVQNTYTHLKPVEKKI